MRGDEIQVVVRAGAARLSPFQYEVDDGHGHQVRGSVLVVLIGDVEPNRAPIANADNATAVTGTERTIDVLANDSDPDGDPVVLVSVDAAGGRPWRGNGARRGHPDPVHRRPARRSATIRSSTASRTRSATATITPRRVR